MESFPANFLKTRHMVTRLPPITANPVNSQQAHGTVFTLNAPETLQLCSFSFHHVQKLEPTALRGVTTFRQRCSSDEDLRSLQQPVPSA